MGVEYTHFLFPEDRSFVPSADALSRLVEALVDAQFLPPPIEGKKRASSWWLSGRSYDGENWGDTYEYPLKRRSNRVPFLRYPPDPQWFSQFEYHDLRLSWSISSADRDALKLRHPLTPSYTKDDISYAHGDLTLAITQNFQKYGLDEILCTPEIHCSCGESLDLSVPRLLNYCQRLANECTCGKTFDPCAVIGTWVMAAGGWGNERIAIPGAGITKFALICEPGKIIPRIRPSFDRSFLAICSEALGQEVAQCGEIA